MRRAIVGYGALGIVVALQGCGGNDKSTSHGKETGADGGGGAPATGGAGGGGAGGVSGAGPGSGGADAGATPDSGSGSGAGGIDGGGPDAAVALRATAVDTHVVETGTVTNAVDLTKYDLAVLVFDAGTGTFSTHPPAITGAGSFEVATLPAGDRYVRYSLLGDAPSYVVTTSDALDLGMTRLGRPDIVHAKPGTELVLDVTGLESWQAGDGLDLYSVGSSAMGFDLPGKSGAPVANDTALNAFTLAYAAGAQGYLIDGAKGDRAYLTQRAVRTFAGGGTYDTLTEAFALPAFTMTDAKATTVSGAFTPVTQSSIDIDWKASRFDAEVAAGNPAAVFSSRSLGGSAQREVDRGFYAGTPDVFRYVPDQGTDQVGTFGYGNPFPAAFGLVVSAGVTFTRDYTLPGTTPLTLVPFADTMVKGSSAVTLEPLVGPVKNFQIAGKDALVDEDAVGVTPTVTFDAPTTGTPGGYLIYISRLFDDGGATNRILAGSVVTTTRKVVVPPGILSAGNSYVVSVTSVVRGNVDLNRQPLATAYPLGRASVLSGIVTP